MTKHAEIDERPGWGFYVFRRHVLDMVESVDRRGTAVCRAAGGDLLLRRACLDAREALERLAGELARRENAAVREAQEE